ncbi:nuclear transport factor 2 family protein [Striga asiatica]|uniref:Nuclear transport factor 2 family protein n=1 Tax=Striga asiatica TaxID=4170 RepID=A0A5A7RI79_STRAF|nr:nuclear transport factor 2 family protein [Striga asiatica]
MADAVGYQQTFSAQIVGRVFVEKYYTILHSSPELAYKFYQDKSIIGRVEEDDSMSVTTTCQAIKEKIVSLNYGDLRVEIKSVDSLESFVGEVLVVVTGHLVGHDNVVKSFTQHFILAPQDNGYFVLSDLLRYVDIVNGKPTLGSDIVGRPITTQGNPTPSVHFSFLVLSIALRVNIEESAIEDEVYSPSEDGDGVFFGGVKVPRSDFADELMRLKGAAASFSSPPMDPGKATLDSGQNQKANYCSIYMRRPPKNAIETSLEDVFKKFGLTLTLKYRNEARSKRPMHLKGAAASFSPPPVDPGKATLNSGHNQRERFGTHRLGNIGGGSGYNKRFKLTSFCPIKENPNLKEEWSLPNSETSLVLLRLPAKHIAVCRCVCSSWLSLTTSPKFISAQLDHARSESDPQVLFHDSSPLPDRDNNPLKPPQSGLVCSSPDTLIIGSINGLICSAGNWMYRSWPTPNDIWIWNPSTGLSKKLPMGIHELCRFSNYQATFAFCWDEESDVYKVVRIISKKWEETLAEVWSSDNNSWEEIDLTNHPSFYHPSHHVNVVPTTSCNVFVGNSPHWAVLDYYGNPFIISFDVKTNKLKRSYFPPLLSFDREKIAGRITNGLHHLILTNWMGKLAVLDAVDYLSADDEYDKLVEAFSDTERTKEIYWLWTMEANGHWIRSCLFSFGFDFHYSLNSVGGGKFMLLDRYSDIAFYDIVERRVIRTYGVPSPFPCISLGFDFVGSLVSIEGSEPIGNDDFSKLITLTWPSHLQMNLSGNKHPKQLFMLPEDCNKFYDDAMERDPGESAVPAPFWECQNHFTPFGIFSWR